MISPAQHGKLLGLAAVSPNLSCEPTVVTEERLAAWQPEAVRVETAARAGSSGEEPQTVFELFGAEPSRRHYFPPQHRTAPAECTRRCPW